MPEGRAGHAALIWRTPRRCNSGACVQVAASGQMILMADSKAPEGPVLSYTRTEFREFILGAKDGDYDDLIR
jgi:Domain of unknown function (DUF397)